MAASALLEAGNTAPHTSAVGAVRAVSVELGPDAADHSTTPDEQVPATPSNHFLAALRQVSSLRRDRAGTSQAGPPRVPAVPASRPPEPSPSPASPHAPAVPSDQPESSPSQASPPRPVPVVPAGRPPGTSQASPRFVPMAPAGRPSSVRPRTAPTRRELRREVPQGSPMSVASPRSGKGSGWKGDFTDPRVEKALFMQAIRLTREKLAVGTEAARPEGARLRPQSAMAKVSQSPSKSDWAT